MPPLNEHEANFLTEFAESRRMERTAGPYFVKGEGFHGQGAGPDTVLNHNMPHAEQPGLWCQWIPGGHGEYLEWDGGEKFYYSPEWMKYIVDHFLKPDAILKQRLEQGWFQQNKYDLDARFLHFTFDHVLNGEIEAHGEDHGDHWFLVVENNVVKVAEGRVTRGAVTEV